MRLFACTFIALLPRLAGAQIGPLPPPKPFQANVSDPMLEPAPPAARQVNGWSDAFQRLRQQSPDDRRAQANVERAEGRWRQSLAVLLPNARLTGQLGYDLLNRSSPVLAGVLGAASDGPRPTVPTGTAVASVSQSIVDVGGWYGLQASGAGTRSARHNLSDVRRRLVAGTARALVAVVAAERIAELNRLGLRQALERAALTERTRDLGAANELDVTRVRQDVEVARGTLILGDEQLRRTREALGATLGEREPVGVRPGFVLDQLVTDTQRQCSRLSDPGARADVRAAQEQLNAAGASRRQASAGYLPTIGVSSALSGFTTEPGFGRLATWSISAVLSVPLWEGGGRAGLVRERRGAETTAEADLQSTLQDVSFEVGQARRAVATAEALLRAAADSRALAQRTDQLTRRSFEVGRSSSLELVQTAAALRQADVLLATREYELVQARLDAWLTEATCEF